MALAFSNLALRFQIGSIVGVAVVSLLALGWVQIDGRARETVARTDAAQADALETQAQQLEINLLQLRRSEKNFLTRSDLVYTREHTDLRKKTDGLLSDIVRTVSKRDPAMATKVEKIAQGVRDYGAGFDRIVVARQQMGLDLKSGHLGVLRERAHEMEKAAVAAGRQDIENGVLQMRRAEKDFMLRLDRSYVDQFDGLAKKFDASVRAAGLPGANETAILAAAEVYRKSFSDWAAAAAEAAAAEKAMMNSHRGIEPTIDEVEKQIAKAAADAVARAEVVSTETESRLIWGYGVVLVVLTVLSLLIARAISRPIGSMTGVMTRLAGGNLEVTIEGTEKTNELGAMARAVRVFRDNAIEQRRLEEAAANEAARAAETRRRTMLDLADTFEHRVGAIVQMVSSAATELEAAAQTLSATAEEASVQATAVASASEEASSNVESVAAATEELATTVREVGRQVESSAQIAARAVGEAERTTTRVQGLAGAAERIGSIVQLINEIAGKTNLLALNATIEAARAGEAGKGFAVVAAEVKQLADQTGKATAEIGTQVGAIQGSTEDAAGAIREIRRTIESMNSIAATISAAVEEQGAATQEIARNLANAAKGAASVNANVAGVSDAAAGSSAASTQVLSSARELSRQAEQLGGAVSGFLAEVRAG
jgi:methyl-accepting chemotaxis protein